MLALAALAAFFALPAAAQDRRGTTELTLFGGGEFGERLYAGTNDVFDRDVDVRDAGTYGLRVGYNITKLFEVEASASRTEADIRELRSFYDRADPRYRSKIGTTDSRHFDLNLTVNFGRRHVQPYVTAGVGANWLEVRAAGVGSDTSTHFAANLGAGVKLWVTPRFGFRLEARGRSSYLNDNGCRSHTTNHDDGCDDRFDRSSDRRWYTSSELTGGLTFAF
jgi:opacity protein-like surface antigen